MGEGKKLFVAKLPQDPFLALLSLSHSIALSQVSCSADKWTIRVLNTSEMFDTS